MQCGKGYILGHATGVWKRSKEKIVNMVGVNARADCGNADRLVCICEVFELTCSYIYTGTVYVMCLN